MYIAPSSGHISLNFNMPFELILRKFEVDVWKENAALFERFMEIHSNPPILYYGFNYTECQKKLLTLILRTTLTKIHYIKMNHL